MEGLKDMELVCWWKLQNSAFQHASSLFGHHLSSPFFITHLVHYFTTLVPLTQKLFSTSYLTKTKMFQLNFTALSPPTRHNPDDESTEDKLAFTHSLQERLVTLKFWQSIDFSWLISDKRFWYFRWVENIGNQGKSGFICLGEAQMPVKVLPEILLSSD